MKLLFTKNSFLLCLSFFFFAFLSSAEEKKENDILWQELNKKILGSDKFAHHISIGLQGSYYARTDQQEWLPLWEQIIPAGNLSQSVKNWLLFVNDPMKNLKDPDGSILKGIKESFLKECEKDGHFKFQEFWKEIEAVPNDEQYLPLCGFQMLCYDARDPDHNLERMGLYEKVMALSLIFDRKDDFEKAKNDFFALHKKASTAEYEHNEISSISYGGYVAQINMDAWRVFNKYEKNIPETEAKELKENLDPQKRQEAMHRAFLEQLEARMKELQEKGEKTKAGEDPTAADTTVK